MTDRPILTVPGVAALFAVSPRLVYRAIEAEQLRAYRLGGKLLRVKREDAEAWFEGHCTQPAAGSSAGSKADGSPPAETNKASERVIVSLSRRQQA